MTRPLHLALIGEKIEYSLSPRIFKAIFKQSRLEGQFDLHSVRIDQLKACLDKIVSSGVNGFSVTIPHKQRVMPFLDEISEVAESVDAVNSVAVCNGRLIGHNTDCEGFTFGLKRAGDIKPLDSVLLLGSGGAARAAAFALHRDFRISRISVAGSSPEKALEFKHNFQRRLEGLTVTTITDIAKVDQKWSLLVNCTPLGGANHPRTSPLPEDFNWRSAELYYDLNYNTDNSVVRRAHEAGLRVIDGSAMLVAQAVRSFELWTGYEVAFEPIYRDVFSGEQAVM